MTLEFIVNNGVGLAMLIIGVYVMLFRGFFDLINFKDNLAKGKFTIEQMAKIEKNPEKELSRIANGYLILFFVGLALIAFAIFFMAVNGAVTHG